MSSELCQRGEREARAPLHAPPVEQTREPEKTKVEEEEEEMTGRGRKMSSCWQSFLDPKKNRSAAQHMKALSRRLSRNGDRCDGLGSKEAVSRLVMEMVGAGNQSPRRAIDHSSWPGFLAEKLQAMRTPLRSSLLAYAKEGGQIQVFHHARFLSSSSAEQIRSSPTDSGKKILRPLSPHLTVYKPRRSSTLSITNRITGAFLTTVLLSFHLLYLKMGPICLSFGNFYQFLFYSSKLALVSLELSALAFTYHLWYGIHHLWNDFGGIGGKRLK